MPTSTTPILLYQRQPALSPTPRGSPQKIAATYLFSVPIPWFISCLFLILVSTFWFWIYSLSSSESQAFAVDDESTQQSYLDTIDQIQNQVNKYRVALEEKWGDLYQQQETIAQLRTKNKSLINKLDQFRSADATSLTARIQEFYSQLNAIEQKAKEYEKKGVLLAGYQEAYQRWTQKVMSRDISGALTEIQEQNKQLDASLAAIEAKRRVNGPATKKQGTIATEAGSFSYSLVLTPLEGTHVRTVSAYQDDCPDDCPTKSLAQLVRQENGFAGIQGTYFCPPDYDFCDNQTNVSFSSIYDSSTESWIYWDKRQWNYRSAVTFAGNVPTFYLDAKQMPETGIAAGITNYPALVADGTIIATADNTDGKQKIRGTRAALGYDDQSIYLAVIKEASVIDAAYVMQALGATHALNLDGGGSTALYLQGKYIEGPGRPLPNAIVLTYE